MRSIHLERLTVSISGVDAGVVHGALRALPAAIAAQFASRDPRDVDDSFRLGAAPSPDAVAIAIARGVIADARRQASSGDPRQAVRSDAP